jgi:hypothetical protein
MGRRAWCIGTPASVPRFLWEPFTSHGITLGLIEEIELYHRIRAFSTNRYKLVHDSVSSQEVFLILKLEPLLESNNQEGFNLLLPYTPGMATEAQPIIYESLLPLASENTPERGEVANRSRGRPTHA